MVPGHLGPIINEAVPVFQVAEAHAARETLIVPQYRQTYRQIVALGNSAIE
jgi:hypothetical protein